MCVIAFSPAPADVPTRDQLARACDANPDGFGWAAVVGSRIVVHRAMDPGEAIDSYLDAVPMTTGPSLFHARIASHGTVDLSNCHPFPVGGDPSVVLAHNGILDITPGPFDSRSDTAILADEVLPRSGIETLDTDPETWERWIGPGNKVVILSTSPRLARHAYILNEPAGSWDAGVWWSNRSYQYTSPPWPERRWEATDDGCAECEACSEYVPAAELVEYRRERICPDCADAILEPAP